MRMGESVTIQLPTVLEYLPVAQACVRETARHCGFTRDSLGKIELALEEAISNTIRHGFGLERAQFEVICERTALGIRIRVRDKGMPFDPSRLPVYNPDAELEDQSGSGMGTFLMRELMDEVSYHNLGMDGKELCMVKHLPGGNIRDQLSATELEAAPAESSESTGPVERIEYHVRRLDPSEAIEVSKCAYKSHGYTFFDDHIYYPERIIELNESGEMVSAVAVTPEGRFMGHAALVYPEPDSRIAELTFIFVDTEFRGQGCMNRMVDFLFTTPKRFELDGLYAYAVTNHVFTQKSMVRFGINDCGILLATSPASWVFKGIAEENPQRISVATSFKYLRDLPPKTLYPPLHHWDMIKRLYKELGRNEDFTIPEGSGPAFTQEASVIHTRVYASEECAEIHITRFGSNIVHEIKTILRDLCLKRMAAINLFLSLESPETFHVTDALERLGFFFAGILPCTVIGDTLVLQYLNNVAFDYGNILTYTQTAKDLLAYIKSSDPNLA